MAKRAGFDTPLGEDSLGAFPMRADVGLLCPGNR